MIDTHCHLTDERLFLQLPDVLSRAKGAGVLQMITIGTELTDAQACLQLCQKYPHVRCAIGVHPNYSRNVTLEELPQLRGLAADRSVVALGEMGLDYFHDDAPRDHQRVIFEHQLQMAMELKLPVVIHSRQSTDDCLAVMRAFPGIRGVFHCFTGSLAEARSILDAGYLIGFTGPITYKKSDELREVVRLTPEDRLVVETDAPYLTPEPMRKQKVNEPALVVHTADQVASIKGKSREEIDAITTANARRLFGL